MTGFHDALPHGGEGVPGVCSPLIFLWCYSINSGMLNSLFPGLLQSENMYKSNPLTWIMPQWGSCSVLTVQNAHTCHKSCAMYAEMNAVCSQE